MSDVLIPQQCRNLEADLSDVKTKLADIRKKLETIADPTERFRILREEYGPLRRDELRLEYDYGRCIRDSGLLPLCATLSGNVTLTLSNISGPQSTQSETLTGVTLNAWFDASRTLIQIVMNQDLVFGPFLGANDFANMKLSHLYSGNGSVMPGLGSTAIPVTLEIDLDHTLFDFWDKMLILNMSLTTATPPGKTLNYANGDITLVGSSQIQLENFGSVTASLMIQGTFSPVP